MATITSFLNQMNDVGVFSYVLPFLLIFAVVFSLLEKSGILSAKGENKGVSAIIAATIGLLSLQFDTVPIFFSKIFPNLGIGIAILVVLLILIVLAGGTWGNNGSKAIAWIIGIIAVLWAVFNWDNWFGYGLSYTNIFYTDYFWSLVWILIAIGAVIAVVMLSKNSTGGSST